MICMINLIERQLCNFSILPFMKKLTQEMNLMISTTVVRQKTISPFVIFCIFNLYGNRRVNT